MQGAPKRQVNAEDMLAELKRVVEASTHAPSAPPSSAATAPRPSASGPETWRSQIDNGGDRAAKAKAGSSIGQPAHSQKSAEAKLQTLETDRWRDSRWRPQPLSA